MKKKNKEITPEIKPEINPEINTEISPENSSFEKTGDFVSGEIKLDIIPENTESESAPPEKRKRGRPKGSGNNKSSQAKTELTPQNSLIIEPIITDVLANLYIKYVLESDNLITQSESVMFNKAIQRISDRFLPEIDSDLVNLAFAVGAITLPRVLGGK